MPHSRESVAPRPAAAMPRIALVGDGIDWHARELMNALAEAGANVTLLRLEDCRFDTDIRSAICMPGFEAGLPDAVFVRTFSGGSFEAVTLRLGILHALRESGVIVCNDPRAIERCVDKSMTSFLLTRAGIRNPPTWVTESKASAREIVRRETVRDPLVLKPLFGSQGRNLRLIRDADALPDHDAVAGVYYLQRFVGVARDGEYRDFRLLVWQGDVIAAMMRHASHWVTNVKQGGRPVAVVPDRAMREIAIRGAAAVGADFAGVDVLHDPDGHPTVLEVNSMPAWSGLQKVAPINIASVLAAGLIAALVNAGKPRGGRVTLPAAQIAEAFRAACRDELDAPKPGNVHVFASGHRMTATEFERSAAAAAAPIAADGARVGMRILNAVEATFAAVGANTNLGIILLCAPLAVAASTGSSDLRSSLEQTLAQLDVEDARLAFHAIVRAAPAGLGRAERHDVFEPASVTLREAMAAAADRDRIARQYASGFKDIFELGEPVLAGVSRTLHPRWATVAVYLSFLCHFPDSHVVRKHGPQVAEDTRRAACGFERRMRELDRPDELQADLLAWDFELKRTGINPGTSADLTVATLFVNRLRSILPP